VVPLLSRVPAGFPSPANDFSQDAIDLNTLVVEHPAATYYVRVQGHSMKNAGIQSGDLLVVDRSREFQDKNIVVAVIDGEFTIKRVCTVNSVQYLVAENDDYKPIMIRDGMNVEIWGVVTFVLHEL
jgi:DNA polymerase V